MDKLYFNIKPINMQSDNIPSTATANVELPEVSDGFSKPAPKEHTVTSNQETLFEKSNFLTFTIVFGVLSIAVSILSPCGMLFGVMGTIFGFKARRISDNVSVVRIGMILNIIGLTLSLIFAILYTIVLSTPELLN